jgi:ketosteroid isomerase-like protein
VSASTNVELVRSIFAAWERGDYSATDWADPEIELVIADGPSPGRWTGLAGLAAGVRVLLTSWEGFRYEAEDYRPLDDERVLVLTRGAGRGRTSGLELGQVRPKGAHLFHISGSRVTRQVFYFVRENALAELNAPSQAQPPRS